MKLLINTLAILCLSGCIEQKDRNENANKDEDVDYNIQGTWKGVYRKQSNRRWGNEGYNISSVLEADLYWVIRRNDDGKYSLPDNGSGDSYSVKAIEVSGNSFVHNYKVYDMEFTITSENTIEGTYIKENNGDSYKESIDLTRINYSQEPIGYVATQWSGKKQKSALDPIYWSEFGLHNISVSSYEYVSNTLSNDRLILVGSDVGVTYVRKSTVVGDNRLDIQSESQNYSFNQKIEMLEIEVDESSGQDFNVIFSAYGSDDSVTGEIQVGD